MDNGREFVLPSGAKLLVSVSSYEHVMALHDALVSELRGQGGGTLDVVNIQKAIDARVRGRAATAAGTDPLENEDKDSNEGLNVLVDRILAIGASKNFRAALFACAEKAVYSADGTEQTYVQFKLGTPGYGVFDNPKYAEQSRGDFYAICKAVAEENLRPFVKALFSMFKAHMANSADTPASSSETGSEKPK